MYLPACVLQEKGAATLSTLVQEKRLASGIAPVAALAAMQAVRLVPIAQ